MVVGEVYDELHSRLPFKVKGTLFLKTMHYSVKPQVDVALMLGDEKYSDFTFVVGEKQFRTHKIILGSASEVFDKLFSSDMEERKTNQCKVDNIEPDIFEQLLRFIYTGELPADFEDVAMKLYEAAHYYRIKNLIKFCSSAVLNKLNKENAMELYEWSTLYEEEKLRLSAWIIIKRLDFFRSPKTTQVKIWLKFTYLFTYFSQRYFGDQLQDERRAVAYRNNSTAYQR